MKESAPAPLPTPATEPEEGAVIAMYDEPGTFDLQVEPWTVGQLRAALEGVADDVLIVVHTAEEPGGNAVVPQVVIDADGPVDPTSNPTVADANAFSIECEFPAGSYYMPKWPGPRARPASAERCHRQ